MDRPSRSGVSGEDVLAKKQYGTSCAHLVDLAVDGITKEARLAAGACWKVGKYPPELDGASDNTPPDARALRPAVAIASTQGS